MSLMEKETGEKTVIILEVGRLQRRQGEVSQQRRQQTPGEQGRDDLGKNEKRVGRQRIRTEKLN